MPTVKFIGEASGPVEWRGVAFEPGRPVSVEDEGLIKAAQGNRFFEVSGAPAPSGTGDGDDDDEDLDGFRIEATGSGWFRVLDPEGREVAKGLRKKAAEDRVAELSEERARNAEQEPGRFGVYSVESRGEDGFAVLKGEDVIADQIGRAHV